LLLVVLLWVGGGLPVRAEQVSVAQLLDAKADYVADFYLTSGGSRYQGSVVHAPGRERREFDTPAGRQILLLRRDIDEAAVVLPDRKLYLRTSFQAMAGMVGGFDDVVLDRSPTGAEKVSGQSTTRYAIAGAGGQSGRFTGTVWMTKDGILMRARGRVLFNGRDTPVELGLTALRRIKADPSAFVPPAGYTGIPLDLSKLGLH
jgi:hypothetical protein